MATPSSVTPDGGFALAPEEAKREDAPKPPKEFDDLISTLPLNQDWIPIRLRKYQDFWIPEHSLPDVMAMQQNFQARPDDLFVLSYPKSGTTWLKALAFAIMNRTRYSMADHPLLRSNPHECVLFIQRLFSDGRPSKLEAMPSPRLLGSHLPYPLLPNSMKGSGSRFLYVCRDPKDVFISRWHFNDKMSPDSVEPIPFGKAFDLYCDGVSPYGSIWEHALGYWEESLRRPEKVLFLKYEEMLEEPAGSAKKLAEFMGCPFSPEEEKEGVVEGIIRLCSFDSLSKLAGSMTHKLNTKLPLQTTSFFRKGEAGDWRNHMSEEMARRMDAVTSQKLDGSGLTFGMSAGVEANGM
ncbi:flavonol sulfotransferase-like [Phoenix dactylifera]|uniref:Sulfotransferase n=1 Tax=Phoenix dactylifera TaxID=42345 RepID=A0A8B9AHM7_PHODC|nr:flavonol sulfotransferase-like [Phoenix dactylifera]